MSGIQQILLAASGGASGDPYFGYTTLLLPGNGTNGAQNNTFLDSSTNAFSITRNGNTTQGTFSPFSQTGWGNYFDGSGDYLSVADNAAFTVGSGDFTVEFWIYPTSFAAATRPFGQADSSGTNVSVSLAGYVYATTGQPVAGYGIGSSSFGVASSINLTLNAWNHYAFVRNGGTLTLYINGTSGGTASIGTSSINDSSNQFAIGRVGEYNADYFQGYISNFRFVKGTAVYTANFTPSTTPLTNITNTSLLTCQSNRFVDNSSNAFAITRNGDVSVQAFSPFNPTAAWSAATNGGSGYFDGSGDYLETTSSQIIPSGNFTIEAWAYITSSSSTQTIVAQGTGVGDGARTWMGIENNSGAKWAVQVGGTQAISSVTPVLNAWHYLAMVYNGSTIKMYLNGTEIASASSTTNASNTTLKIGTNWGSYITTGFISNIRISNTARTISAVPSSLLTTDANTVFLANFTNAGIYDATSKNDLETVGNAQISTTQSKFGGSSIYFDGTGDYLFSPSRATTALEGDFTVEFWVYRTAGNNRIFTLGDSYYSNGFDIYIGNSGANLRLYSVSVVIDIALSGISFPASEWNHFALVRYGGVVKIYVNGINVGSSWSSTTTFSGSVYVGAEFYNGSIAGTFNGYMQDLRITKGIARYTSNFTPPTAAFPVF